MLVRLLVLLAMVEWSVGQSNFGNVFDIQLHEDVIDEQLCTEHLAQMNTFEFYDASFRFPQGFLTGNFLSYGNYFQCLDIKQEISEDDTIEGKHCLIDIPFDDPGQITLPTLPPWFPELNISWPEQNQFAEKMQKYNQMKRTVDLITGRQDSTDSDITDGSATSLTRLRLAVCIPKSCSVNQALGRYFNTSLLTVNYNAVICRIPDDKPFVAVDYVAIVIFSVIGLLALLSTAYELRHVFILKNDPKKINPLYSACSVYSNTRNLFTFSNNPRVIHCLDGIRSFSIIWVVVGHTFLNLFSAGVSNIYESFEWYQDIRALWLTSANISVDTFLMLSGFLLVYTSVSKMTQASFLKSLHKYYLNRYLRMFPVLATAALLQASLFNHMADGANWALEGGYINKCRKDWWATLLFIQNYYNPNEECLPHTWYLAVDFQLHLLSPIVLIWTLGSRRAGWTGLATALIVALVGGSIFIVTQDFDANMFITVGMHYFKWYYVNTFVRAPTFLVGMLFGYLLFVTRGKKIELPAWFVSVCWASAVVLFGCVIYIYYPQTQFDHDNRLLDTISNCFNRSLWCFAMGWVIFACVHGYAGPLNWFLSLTMWKFIARISYFIYIFHYPMQFLRSAAVIAPVHFSLTTIWMYFFNDMVLSVAVSIVIAVFIDSPFATVQRILLGGGGKKPPPKRPPQNRVQNEVQNGVRNGVQNGVQNGFQNGVQIVVKAPTDDIAPPYNNKKYATEL